MIHESPVATETSTLLLSHHLPTDVAIFIIAEKKEPTLAVALASRDPNRKGDLDFNGAPDKITIFKVVDGPEGCNGKNFEDWQYRCQEATRHREI